MGAQNAFDPAVRQALTDGSRKLAELAIQRL